MKPWRFAVVFGRLVPLFKQKNLMEDRDCFGVYQVTDPRKGLRHIIVDADLKGDALMQTVLHEIFHAVLDRTHSHDAGEEATVDQLAQAVVENFNLRWKK